MCLTAVFHREAAFAVMDRNGQVERRDCRDSLLAARYPRAVRPAPRPRPGADAAFTSAWEANDVVLLELSDLERADAYGDVATAGAFVVEHKEIALRAKRRATRPRAGAASNWPARWSSSSRPPRPAPASSSAWPRSPAPASNPGWRVARARGGRRTSPCPTLPPRCSCAAAGEAHAMSGTVDHLEWRRTRRRRRRRRRLATTTIAPCSATGPPVRSR